MSDADPYVEAVDVPVSKEVHYEQMRWLRAVSWARGDSAGPWGMEDGEGWLGECCWIQSLYELILKYGEEAAEEFYESLRAEDPRAMYEVRVRDWWWDSDEDPPGVVGSDPA